MVERFVVTPWMQLHVAVTHWMLLLVVVTHWILLQDTYTLRADTRVCCHAKSAIASDAMTSQTTIHSILLR